MKKIFACLIVFAMLLPSLVSCCVCLPSDMSGISDKLLEQFGDKLGIDGFDVDADESEDENLNENSDKNSDENANADANENVNKDVNKDVNEDVNEDANEDANEDNGTPGLEFVRLSNGTYEVAACKATETKNIVIPAKYNGISVTKIGDFAFLDCSDLTSVTIPDSVTSIGDGAFRYCYDLAIVTIPYSVTNIGNGAFYGCSGLTSVTLPDSVTNIDDWAFRDCSGLTSITVPDSVTNIGIGAFYGCSGLTSITVPFVGEIKDGTGETNFGYIFGSPSNYYVPSSLKTVVVTGGTSISGGAFEDCSGLTSITIPDSVTSIGSYAFCDCSSLTSITIPADVTSIGSYAFGDCYNLASVTFEYPYGWSVASSSYLSSPSTAAYYLTSTYESYEWTRS